MGVDHHIFIGPYAECIYPTVGVMKTVLECKGNTLHKPLEGNKFCFQCGAEVVVKSVETDKTCAAFDAWEISEEVKERLHHASSMSSREIGAPNTDYWMSNLGDSDGISLDRYEQTVEPINTVRIYNETARFHQEFEKELAVLREHYISVTVKWGLVAYCS